MIEDISNKDRVTLANVAHIAIDRFIWNSGDIKRIAEYTTNGDMVQAFEDVIEKGIRELIAMCDMDDYYSDPRNQ